jgi:hypothetical protein
MSCIKCVLWCVVCIVCCYGCIGQNKLEKEMKMKLMRNNPDDWGVLWRDFIFTEKTIFAFLSSSIYIKTSFNHYTQLKINESRYLNKTYSHLDLCAAAYFWGRQDMEWGLFPLTLPQQTKRKVNMRH